MAGFFNKLKVSGAGGPNAGTKDASSKKKEDPAPEMTPLEKMLQNASALREDGSDKFFGLENFGNTCYCNSIVQALYHSVPFRENVVNFPPFSPSDTPSNNGLRPKVSVSIRPPMNGAAASPAKQKPLSAAEAQKARKAINSGQPVPGQPTRPEDKPDSPEYKKKQAMIKGPVLELGQENSAAYGMDECTFTGLKDIFMALIESGTRTGVLSPQRFLEVFKRDNEMFRNSMHQDAHEFYGLVLNDVIANVEANARRLQEREEARNKQEGLVRSLENALGGGTKAGARSPGTGWVHDIFEGLLTSETRCLACETTSQRDETFLDLSIDLEEHTSVTSCLNSFSAEEMLCERNKFHCDHCGGLQEAEKRMKIKRLPKTLALHLKRFKYTEDYSRLQKLFHRVVYPYYLRLLHTTDDAEDPDRMYELYAVVVHIGGNAYHGHYVAVIKTPDRGWLLFDDEMVEPVDKHFVKNFFGDKPGMACAYVLFYQEITFEQYLAQIAKEGLEEAQISRELAIISGSEHQNGVAPLDLSKTATQPVTSHLDNGSVAVLEHAKTTIGIVNGPSSVDPAPAPAGGPVPVTPVTPATPLTRIDTSSRTTAADGSAAAQPAAVAAAAAAAKSKEEKEREKKDAKAAEKARKAAEKEKAKLEEKQRKDAEARLREARRSEAEDLKKAMQLSRQLAEQGAGAAGSSSTSTTANGAGAGSTALAAAAAVSAASTAPPPAAVANGDDHHENGVGAATGAATPSTAPSTSTTATSNTGTTAPTTVASGSTTVSASGSVAAGLGAATSGFLSRASIGSKSMSKKSLGFLKKDRSVSASFDQTPPVPELPPLNGGGPNHNHHASAAAADGGKPAAENNNNSHAPAAAPLTRAATDKPESGANSKIKDRFSFGIGKKKSNNVLT